jgi:AraC-like DNA-binding protein
MFRDTIEHAIDRIETTSSSFSEEGSARHTRLRLRSESTANRTGRSQGRRRAFDHDSSGGTITLGIHLLHPAGCASGVARLIPERYEGGLAAWQQRRVIELMNKHYDRNLTLRKLAEECRLSVSHFSRTFKQSFGTSVHRHLILRRVEAAQAMLLRSTRSLAEIALLAGFADQAAFCRTFSAIVGVTPGRWRREHFGNIAAASEF